jgi:DNA-binding NtrC family response regulator
MKRGLTGQVQGKILIVDDNEDFASILEAMLDFEGYQVRTARDARDGYLAFALFRPDLVITDIQMPGKSGLELIKEIRTQNPEVRTIYMSGDPGRFRREIEEEMKRHRARLLQKPFSAVDLRDLLAGLL